MFSDYMLCVLIMDTCDFSNLAIQAFFIGMYVVCVYIYVQQVWLYILSCIITWLVKTGLGENTFGMAYELFQVAFAVIS